MNTKNKMCNCRDKTIPSFHSVDYHTKQTLNHAAVFEEVKDYLALVVQSSGDDNGEAELIERVSKLQNDNELMLEALEAVLNMGDDYEAEKLVREALKKAGVEL